MTTNTFKTWIDFDWIFVRDIPDFKMTDDEYLARIRILEPLKISEKLFALMENTDWCIITGRKHYLQIITDRQLRKVVPEKFMKNFKGIYYKHTNIPDFRFKIEKCRELEIDLYIESNYTQSIQIWKQLNCIHYEKL